MERRRSRYWLLVVLLGVVGLGGCSGGGSSGGSATYSVGGSISGLTGSGLVLRDNGTDSLSIASGATHFTFSTTLADRQNFLVTVATQPSGQTCTVGQSSGVVSGTNVTTVSVICVAASASVGGSVSGLTGSGLVLQDNGGDNLTIASGSAAFTFATKLPNNASYAVTVYAQPAGQTCTIANGNGTISGANITNVAVTCAANTYSVGGTVSGLTASGLVLQDNGSDNLSVASGATTFTFATKLANGSSYSVTVSAQPTGQTCSVTSANGTLSGANVSNVGVSCAGSVPSAPTGVSANAGNNQVTLSWVAVSGATGYNVYRSNTSGLTTASGTKLTASPSTTSPYVDSTAANGTTYYYIVTAVNGTGESSASTQVSAIPSSGGAAANSWSAKLAMPTAEAQVAVAQINGILYVAGGNAGSGATSNLQAYNPVTNAWSPLASMPTGNYQGAGAVEINGKLYVAGGWNGSLPISNLQIYDPVAGTWSSGTAMPILSGCGASGAINGKLYVITPCNGVSGYYAYLHVYSPASNSWTALTNSLQVHSAPASGVINGKFYVAGGLSGPAGTTGPWAVNGYTEVYDPVANSWTALTAMPTPVQAAASAVYNGKLYVIGGVNASSTYISTVQVYDPVSNSWSSSSAAALPSALGWAGAATINGVIYAAGGSATGAAGTGLLAFTPPANASPNTWAAKAAMPAALALTTAAEVNGQIYVAGGCGANPCGAPMNSMLAYNPATNTWTTKTAMPTARVDMGAASVNGILYVMGGDNYSCSPYGTVEAYDPAANSWSTMTSMPTPRSDFAVSVVDGIIYTIGGNAYCGTTYTAVEAYNPATNTWSTKTALPSALADIVSATVNGIIYVVGGGGGITNVLAFDPHGNAGAGSWTAKAAIPSASTYNAGPPAVFAVNGIIYMAGGDNTTALVQAYDPIHDSWSTKASLPTGVIWGIGGASVNGIGYALGGWINGGAPANASQAYTP